MSASKLSCILQLLLKSLQCWNCAQQPTPLLGVWIQVLFFSHQYNSPILYLAASGISKSAQQTTQTGGHEKTIVCPPSHVGRPWVAVEVGSQYCLWLIAGLLGTPESSGSKSQDLNLYNDAMIWCHMMQWYDVIWCNDMSYKIGYN